MTHRIHVNLIGSGTEEDPYRVSLPTYNIVDIDYTNKQAIVDVPHEDVPEGLPMVDVSDTWTGGKTRRVHRLPVTAREQWNELLRSRYREGHSTIDVDGIVKPEA